jgi:hypothetical protein
MQGIYTYIPETNDVPTEYNVAAILSLLFMAPISLVPALTLMYFYISTFRSMCAVPNMAVFCSFIIIIILFYFFQFHKNPVHVSKELLDIEPVMLQLYKIYI